MHDVDVEAIDNISTYLDSLNLTLASVTLNIKTNFLFHWKIQTTTFSSHRSAEIKYIFDLISVPVGLQLFGSFQKIMKRPPQSFVLATNWLLDGPWTPPQKKWTQPICQSKNLELANWQHIGKLAYWQIDGIHFWGDHSTSNSQLVANTKTWWSPLFLKRPKKLHPYWFMELSRVRIMKIVVFRDLISSSLP